MLWFFCEGCDRWFWCRDAGQVPSPRWRERLILIAAAILGFVMARL
jgi:hypothetical protein